MIKFKVKKPKLFNKLDIYNYLVREMNQIAREIQADFEDTVVGWEEEVNFTVRKRIGFGSKLVVRVETDNQIYIWVNSGTKKHEIPGYGMINDPPLAFREAYSPMTVPGSLESRSASEYGDLLFRGYVLEHPGIEPRRFDEQIRAKWEREIHRRLQRALNQAFLDVGQLVDVRVR